MTPSFKTESHTESYRIVCSRAGNNYLLSNSAKEMMLIHPILGFIIEKYRKNTDLSSWLDLGKEVVDIGRNLIATRNELEYYYNYFQFLEANGYFETVKKRCLHDKQMSPEMAESYFSNADRMSLEVTENCNLACTYCGLGELYHQDVERTGKNLSFKTAQNLIDYFNEKQKSKKSGRAFKDLTFSFYGGEPLLNFPLIQQLVRYIKTLDWKTCQVKFQVTTNGILLNRYREFLVENDFTIVVSMDGNKYHNSYRVGKDGSQSFDAVSSAIDALIKEHPDFFESKVKFNTVIHSKNNPVEAIEFFEKLYRKKPSLISLTSKGVNPDQADLFNQISPSGIGKTQTTSVNSGEQDPEVSLKQLSKIDIYQVLLAYSVNINNNYSQLLRERKSRININTGTCNPFKQKIFCTAAGYLLPCEKISPQYALGKVDDEKVLLDFRIMAEKYKEWYKHLSQLCDRCYKGKNCSKCMFFIEFDADPPSCDEFYDSEAYHSFLKNIISALEKNPDHYTELLHASPSMHRDANIPNQQSSWLFLHPYVHLNIKNDWAVLYNSLNGKLLEYSDETAVLRILRKLKTDLYVTMIPPKDLSKKMAAFIGQCRLNYFGDILDTKLCKSKPFQAKPILRLAPTHDELTFKSKIPVLENDEIGDFLKVASFYLNNSCHQDCPNCSYAFKQVLNCTAGRGQSKELNPNDIDKFLNEAQSTSLYKLNILGGNILEYPFLESLVKILSKYDLQIDYYINYHNIAEDSVNSIDVLRDMPGMVHAQVNPPLMVDILNRSSARLGILKMPVKYHFIVEGEKDFNSAQKMIATHKLQNYDFSPVYTEENGRFFEDNLFITKEAIESSKPTMKNTFARTTLNTLSFGNIIVLPDKRVYANLNRSSIGKFGRDTVLEIIKNELSHGTAWNRVRKNVLPCKSCPYNALCPPISNYEYAIGQYNLCKIWSQPHNKSNTAHICPVPENKKTEFSDSHT